MARAHQQGVGPAVPVQEVPHGARLARLRPAAPLGGDARLEGAPQVETAGGRQGDGKGNEDGQNQCKLGKGVILLKGQLFLTGLVMLLESESLTNLGLVIPVFNTTLGMQECDIRGADALDDSGLRDCGRPGMKSLKHFRMNVLKTFLLCNQIELN